MSQTMTKKRPDEPVLAAGTPGLAGKYLTFQLDREEFAIRVTQVREIIGLQETTNVPQLPAYVKGVINLRGRVIPVVSLRLKFGLGEGETTYRTCIVVVEVRGSSGESVQVGVIVDGVSEVVTLQAADLEQPPDFGRGRSVPYLLGMAKIKGKVKILLDIDYVLGQEEVLGLQAALAA